MKGTIRERCKKDGTVVFTCQVDASRDPATNKRRYRTGTATTRREANSLLHTMMAEVDETMISGTDATILTLGELIERRLELGGPPADSTRMVYDGYIKNQIRPHLWDSRLDQLRVADMDRWYLTLRESGPAQRPRRFARHTIVRAALAQGVRWGWIHVDIAAMAKLPAVPKPVIATPRASDVKRLVEFVARTDLAMATYIRLSGVTGARPGEVCGLHWHDIDFVTGDVTVRRRIMRSSNGMFPEDLTKTGKVR